MEKRFLLKINYNDPRPVGDFNKFTKDQILVLTSAGTHYKNVDDFILDKDFVENNPDIFGELKTPTEPRINLYHDFKLQLTPSDLATLNYNFKVIELELNGLISNKQS